MKESKFLKMVSYVMIPILVAIMILSSLSNYIENTKNIYENEKDYFATDNFVASYMSTLSIFSNCLIYQNEEYPICYDDKTQISYVGEAYESHDIRIKDCYILIQYKDKAITNVELTSETNTIDKIKQFISANTNSKKVNILAGNIEADSDVVSKKGIKYFNDFETTYYTIDEETAVFQDGEEPIEITEQVETVYETQKQKTRKTSIYYSTYTRFYYF